MTITQEQIADMLNRLRHGDEFEKVMSANKAADMLEQLATDNARLREALEFYAPKTVTYQNIGKVTFQGHDDNGQTALAALEPAPDALKARAEKAEAELERVKEMRDQIVGDKINLRGELATMRVEVKRLRAALFECQEEIDDYIRHEYPHDHPVQERYRQRDYAANPARIALQEKDHD